MSRLNSEAGPFFFGRRKALTDLLAFMSGGDNGQVSLVTGSSGVGKSALLARIVWLARMEDEEAASSVAAAHTGASVASQLDGAFQVRGESTSAIAAQIGSIWGLSSHEDDVNPILIAATQSSRKVIIVDGVDEAEMPEEVIRTFLVPLSRIQGLRLIVACDRRYISEFGAVVSVVDLDTAEYFDSRDLREMVLNVLLGRGDLYNRTPYIGDLELANSVAEAVAEKAGRNFLIAYIASRDLAEMEVSAVAYGDDWSVILPSSINAAVDGYLSRHISDDQSVRSVLLLLASARGIGYRGDELWSNLRSTQFRGNIVENDPSWLRYQFGWLIDETVDDSGVIHYRLFHSSIARRLTSAEEEREIERRVVDALSAMVSAPGGQNDWRRAHPYLRAHLSTHAAAAGKLDELICDPLYLLLAESQSLLRALPAVTTQKAREAAQVYQIFENQLRTRTIGEAASALELVARQNRIDWLALAVGQLALDQPWRVTWTQWTETSSHRLIGRHAGAVEALDISEINGVPIAVSGGADGMIRRWNLETGEPIGDPRLGNDRWVDALVSSHITTQTAERQVVVSAGSDAIVQVWDVLTGAPIGPPLRGHAGWIHALASCDFDESSVVISVSDDGTLRRWNIREQYELGEPSHVPPGVEQPMDAVAAGVLDGRPVAISGGRDGLVRVWDVQTGAELGSPLAGHEGPVWAVAAHEMEGRLVCASVGADSTLRLWDLNSRALLGPPLVGHFGSVDDVSMNHLDGHTIVVTCGGGDGTVRVWDPAAGRELRRPMRGHDGQVYAVSSCIIRDEICAVSGGRDGTVRLWPLHNNSEDVVDAVDQAGGHVWVIVPADVNERTIIASAESNGAIRLRDTELGGVVGQLLGHEGEVYALTAGRLGQTPIAVSGGADKTIRVWNLQTNEGKGPPLIGHEDLVTTVIRQDVNGRPCAVSTARDGTIRCWDLERSVEIGAPLGREGGPIWAAANCEIDGRMIIVSAGADGAIRRWDISEGRRLGDPLVGEGSEVYALITHQRGQDPIAISGAVDGTIRRWNLRASSGSSNRLSAHVGEVRALAIFASGEQEVLISGGADARVCLWDLTTGEAIATPIDVSAAVTSLLVVSSRVIIATHRGLIALEFPPSWQFT